MSWFWGSSKPKATIIPPEAAPTPDITSVQSETTIGSEASVPSQPLSQDEQDDPDLIAMLKEFQAEADKLKGARIRARETGDAGSIPVPDDISPDSLYPTELSCRSALDYAMFCQSFGGQFVNVYRYGSFRSCSNHWSDFWMCMRTRNWEEKERKRAVQDHYKQKAIKWKAGPSSEDIWEVRTEPVKDAFQDNLEELEARIAEWKKANPGVPDPWLKQQGSTFAKPPSASS